MPVGSINDVAMPFRISASRTASTSLRTEPEARQAQVYEFLRRQQGESERGMRREGREWLCPLSHPLQVVWMWEWGIPGWPPPSALIVPTHTGW